MGKMLKKVCETFNLQEGWHRGAIRTILFYEKSGTDRAMIKIALPDGTTFMNSVTEEQLSEYPFSQLISEVDASTTDDLIGVKVRFQIKNKESDYGMTFSNIKKIEVDTGKSSPDDTTEDT